jgi:ATP-binding cassette subfamily C protein/ATP-binding cassette subfamily C protein EexD
VLDEPNSSLDAVGEQALSRAIADMKSCGSTIVVIAHRPMLLAQLDQILVLQEGQVQLFGPRDAVLAQSSRPKDAAIRPPMRVVRGGQ